MDFLKLKEEFKTQSYDSIVLATTSNHSSDFLRLPDKYINGQKCMSFSIANTVIATEVIQVFDGTAKYIYVDVERKQNIDFITIAQENISISRLREMKPNDLAMEAADILIYKTIKDKNANVLIVGTGNIGIKLAIRLTERNYNVYLHGRNKEKVENFVAMINQMVPKYGKKISAWDNEPIDVLCTMVSALEVIDDSYTEYLNKGALAIDGGIGNFSKGFIKNAHLKDINVLRLDVRISNDLLNGIDQSYNSNFFTDIKGEKDFNGIHIVSGGIIGKEGDVIVDRIHIPKRVIGIANGIGGVKPADTISEVEKEQIAIINEEIKKEADKK
ncbi:NAD(P)-binding domain-containing protein [Macrococcus sp. EM39E]|uniref:NAD(P)-binding domain-containing protein n=1 Tax=Macrococcus animalis TaxID=3395467 RepID=UPI0039BFF438